VRGIDCWISGRSEGLVRCQSEWMGVGIIFLSSSPEAWAHCPSVPMQYSRECSFRMSELVSRHFTFLFHTTHSTAVFFRISDAHSGSRTIVNFHHRACTVPGKVLWYVAQVLVLEGTVSTV
jgi:hypothetical protein